MGMQLVLLLLAAAPAAGSNLPVGAELTYRGSFTAEKGDPAGTRKTFDLTLYVARADAQGASVFWVLEERGHGAWPWPYRFGQMELDSQGHSRTADGPSLLYVREQGTSEAPITAPVFQAGRTLEAGLKWDSAGLQHHVVDQEKSGDARLWKVEIRDAYGIRRVVRVDSSSPLVRWQAERVFIGQGEQFELAMEVLSEKALPADDAKTVQAAVEKLAALRQTLSEEPRRAELNWGDEQIARLQRELPEIAKLAPTGAVGRLLEDAQQDARRQSGQAGAVAALRKQLIGSELPEFALEGLAADKLTSAAVDGKVTVLHFWDYRDTPLEEPYGQVAYLDFLHRNRKSEDVQICGVVADPRLDDAATRPVAIRGAKKLRSFMNLSYPVYVDGGLLKQLGDPRVSGAKLPLFVVIGRDGKVVDYHCGFYEVTRDRGLEELEKSISKALSAGE